jgi:hypothetical protein
MRRGWRAAEVRHMKARAENAPAPRYATPLR